MKPSRLDESRSTIHTLQIQDRLRSFDSPDEAIGFIQGEPLNLKVQRKGDLLLLNYDQIRTPQNDETDDCRALILRMPTFDVVSRSFRRFYNFNEGRAANIDWSTARTFEKLDGSLVVFFHDGERWRMQTRGTIDAECPIYGTGYTFAERILACLERYGFSSLDTFMSGVDHEHCCAFEYVGRYNRVVTFYEDEDLYHLATFDRRTGRNCLEPLSCLAPKAYSLQGGFDDVLAIVNSLPKLQEGCVVVDGSGNRIKVKNPAYMALHAAINAGNAPTEKNFARLALGGDTGEIKSYFPEFAAHIEGYESAVDSLACDAEGFYREHQHIESQKQFAMAVKAHPLSGWMFARRSGKLNDTAEDWIRKSARSEKFVIKFIEMAKCCEHPPLYNIDP